MCVYACCMCVCVYVCVCVHVMLLALRLSSDEMESVTWVQILDEAVCVLLRANVL